MKTINISLNGKRYSIDKAIQRLQKEKQDLVENKCQRFCKKLIERGIRVSQANSGDFKGYLLFKGEFVDAVNGKVHYIYMAQKKSDISVEWEGGGYDIDPLLMAEFGSGWKAEVLLPVDGVGQGTHPEQKHANDPNGWRWKDKDGDKWHYSTGLKPTHPVYLAWVEMQNCIQEVAKEVFK